MNELTIYPLAIGGVYKSYEGNYVIAVNYCELELTKELAVIYKLLDYSNDTKSYMELDKLYVCKLDDWFREVKLDLYNSTPRYSAVAASLEVFNRRMK